MVDHVSILTVSLEKDVSVIDTKPLIAAISMFKGVLAVQVNVRDPEAFCAQTRAKHELLGKIQKVLS